MPGGTSIGIVCTNEPVNRKLSEDPTPPCCQGSGAGAGAGSTDAACKLDVTEDEALEPASVDCEYVNAGRAIHKKTPINVTNGLETTNVRRAGERVKGGFTVGTLEKHLRDLKNRMVNDNDT